MSHRTGFESRKDQTWSFLLVLLLGAGQLVACKANEKDLEMWKDTVKGPDKIKAVMLSDKYSVDLRSKAALTLVEMDRRDVEAVDEFKKNVQRLDNGVRNEVIHQILPGLKELMNEAPAVEGPDSNQLSEAQIRAKDAAYVLAPHTKGDDRKKLLSSLVNWYVQDYNGRREAGNYSAEQVVEYFGADAANMLVDAFDAKLPSAALIKLAELIGTVGDPKTKIRAGEQLIKIERQMETPQYVQYLEKRITEQLKKQSPDGKIDPKRVLAAAVKTRESHINEGALPAMKPLASVDAVADRLVALGTMKVSNPQDEARAATALVALEGSAKRRHAKKLLEVALSSESTDGMRLLAFDRVGDTKSPEAIPPMWKLVGAKDNAEGDRARAGELVLAVGQSGIVPEFLRRLPAAGAYEPTELTRYAARMSQMSPPPMRVMRSSLTSPLWWQRSLALMFLERKGEEEDIQRMRGLVKDETPLQGSQWKTMKLTTVGQVAKKSVKTLREKLSDESGS